MVSILGKIISFLLKPIVDFIMFWFCSLFYYLLVQLLMIVDIMKTAFNIFAGLQMVKYDGHSRLLIDLFFDADIVTRVYSLMFALALVFLGMFIVVQIYRKTFDLTEKIQDPISLILKKALAAFINLLLLSVVCISALKLCNLLLIQIDIGMRMAMQGNNPPATEKNFSDDEYARMAYILRTVQNFSLNADYDSTANVASCFNEIRPELLKLEDGGFFKYMYEGPLYRVENKTEILQSCSWQYLIYNIGTAVDLGMPVPENEKNDSLTRVFREVRNVLQTSRTLIIHDKVRAPQVRDVEIDTIIFLIASLKAAKTKSFRQNPSFADPLRVKYLNGEADYRKLSQVEKDFDIRKIDYIVGVVAAVMIGTILFFCGVNFISRMFELTLLYLVGPLFLASSPIDDGEKFKMWRQAFMLKLLSGFGPVIVMNLYLMVLPIFVSPKLQYIAQGSLGNQEFATYNYIMMLLFVIGGSYAVLKSTTLITVILSGSPTAMANAETRLLEGASPMALPNAMNSIRGRVISRMQSKDLKAKAAGNGGQANTGNKDKQ